MFKVVIPFVLFLVMWSAKTAFAQPPTAEAKSEGGSSVLDARTLVEMPAKNGQLMREEMLAHLSALNTIIGHLAVGDMEAAADVAETELGKSSMGKHRGTGMGPGRYMPPEMHSIGRGMHLAASELAVKAKAGDRDGALAGLQKVSSACVACHNAYRIR